MKQRQRNRARARTQIHGPTYPPTLPCERGKKDGVDVDSIAARRLVEHDTALEQGIVRDARVLGDVSRRVVRHMPGSVVWNERRPRNVSAVTAPA